VESHLGTRIRTLRERAGIQSQELATRIGVDPSAMSNIESGKRAVKTGELVLIAEALSVSPLALLDEDSLPARVHVAARPDGEQPTVKGPAFARLQALSEIHDVLSESGLTNGNNLNEVPDFTHPWSWKAEAEQLATWATEYLQVDAAGMRRFASLADAIEKRLRVDVLVEKYLDDPLSGATIADRDFPLIFVNSQHPTPRALFTLAHECGHLLLNHGQVITVDDNLAGVTREERQANAFAAAFLMPAEKVDEYLARYGRGAESLAQMIYNFGVSFESLVYRLYNLRKIDTGSRDNLQAVGWQGLLHVIEGTGVREHLGAEISMQLISRLGQHPADRPPVWLADRCFSGFQRGVISVRPLAGLFNIDPDVFLDRVYEDDARSVEALERAEVAQPEEQVTDDDLFTGSPVS
jgi:Zn-dependent peptidase ImmA (M78 family)/transcriptional regulator with XRE-family HTH domain